MGPLPWHFVLLLGGLSAALSTDNPGDDCMPNSMTLKSLTVTRGQVNGASPATGDDSSVSFELQNQAINLTVTCSAKSQALTPGGSRNDPYKWYPCSAPEGALNVAAAFQYDSVVNWVTVNETWICSDAAADHV